MKTKAKRLAGFALAAAMTAFSLPLTVFAQENTDSFTLKAGDLLTLNYVSPQGEGFAQRIGKYESNDAEGSAYLVTLPYGATYDAEDVIVKDGYELSCYSLVADGNAAVPDKAESLEQGLKTPLTDNDFKSYNQGFWSVTKNLYYDEGYSMPIKQVKGVLLTLSCKAECDVIILQTSTRDPYSPYWEGKGYQSSPYLIKDGADLKELSDSNNIDNTDYSGIYFRLENDVTLPDGWQPVGTSKNRFGGYIDGNGKTLTVPAGSLSLIGVPSGAKLSDLSIYGEKIPGYGVIQGYTTGCTMDIYNVTIRSGSHILYSGFVGGYGSDSVNIYNSTVESGVVIGDDGSWGDLGDTDTVYPFVGTFSHRDNIGSFGGAFNGTISGCVSYATVYGHNNVGGIVGFKGQSMRDFYINNCAFYGDIVSNGEMLGGIVGNGYTSGSAPATPCVTIENCYATGKISGENNVGGIFGGEKGAKACRNNGIGRIRNNYFAGSVKASSDDAAVGGIIGYMNTMDRYNIIYNNYYINNCGSKSGIGKLEAYVSAEEDSHYGIAADPTGAGAATIAVGFSPAALTDGTLVAKLNSSKTAPDYEQGELYPVFGGNTHITSVTSKSLLTSPEKSVTAYTDYSALENYDLTVKYSDGTFETVPSSDGVFSGVDFTVPDYQLAGVEYGNYSMDFGVKVSPVPNGKTAAYITVLGDYPHGREERHTLKEGGLTEWVKRTSYVIDGSTVKDLLDVCFEDKGLIADESKGYISSVTFGDTTVGEFTNGRYCGWQYMVNGESPDRSMQDYVLSDGDEVVFYYTDNYVIENWDTSFDSDKVTVTIDDLPNAEDVTLEDKADVLKAAEMFDKLSDAEKAYVPDEEKEKLGALLERLDKLSAEENRRCAHEIYLETAKLLKNYAETNTVSINAIGGDWIITGLARSGYITDKISDAYYSEVAKAVAENGSAKLHRAKSTENSRVVLALTAIGRDVTNVVGYDLLQPLSDLDYVKTQGVNGPIWALIAFDSHDYEIPAADVGKTQTTREALISYILDEQHTDGGWGLEKESEPDITAMAVQALAPYRKDNAEVLAAVNAAVEYLSDCTESLSGAYPCETSAQIAAALCAVGEDICSFSDGRIMQMLTDNFTEKGFSHSYGESADQMSTEQAFLALNAYERLLAGEPSLYDMGEIEITLAPADSGDKQPNEPEKDKDNTDSKPNGDNVGTGTDENPNTGVPVVCGESALAASSILFAAALLLKKKRK